MVGSSHGITSAVEAWLLNADPGKLDMTVLDALAILEAATLESKQRDIYTPEVREALDFLQPCAVLRRSDDCSLWVRIRLWLRTSGKSWRRRTLTATTSTWTGSASRRKRKCGTENRSRLRSASGRKSARSLAGEHLSADDHKKVLAVYPMWLARLAEFAKETYLSQGDLLHLTDDEIDTRLGVIKPEGGRIKTGVERVSPLTKRAREILDEIRREKRSGAIIPNVNGLVFTKEDGAPITKRMINGQIEKAVRKTRVKKFVFHNYRNTALTEWARRVATWR